MDITQNSKRTMKFSKYSKTQWTTQEDGKLLESIREHGMLNWSVIANDIPNRNGKQCRERYKNHLSPDVNHDDWNSEEDAILLLQHKFKGNQWLSISSFLPGRSPNHVKNRYNFLMNKNRSFLLLNINLALNSQNKDHSHSDQIEEQDLKLLKINEMDDDFNEYFDDSKYCQDKLDDFFL
jgi:hypothetical protein